MPKAKVWIVVLMLSNSLVACKGLGDVKPPASEDRERPASEDAKRPATLYVPSDATNVTWTDQFAGAVEYMVEREFPATEMLQEIGSLLSSEGFSPVPQDLFNPDQENSHTRGWGDYIDGDSRVFAWIADWRDERGDQVRYELQYRIPSHGSAARRQLRVSATQIDVTSVMRLRSRLESLRKEQP